MAQAMAQPRQPGRFRMWLGHYAPYILITVVAFMVAGDLLEIIGSTTGGMKTAVSIIQSLVSFAWLFAVLATFAQIYHDKQLCVRCVNDSPLTEPAEVVKRRDRELKAFHSPPLTFGILLFFLAVSVWELVASKSTTHSIWGLCIDILALVAFGYNAFVFKTHARLALWCPYCRDDGWNDGDEEPADPNGPPSGRRRIHH